MMNRSFAATMITLTFACHAAHAVNVCNFSETIDMSDAWIPPFGGEYIGVMAANGEVVNTNIDIQFTATGTFNAADIAVAIQINDAFGSVSVGFSGAQLGWSGQGTFTHTFDSDLLNGSLFSGDQPFSTMFIFYSNLNFDNGPITGNFDRLVFRIDFAECPRGDVNHDINVDIDDLLAVIAAWGDCPPQPKACPADFDGTSTVDIDDLLTVISNWGQWCPNCS